MTGVLRLYPRWWRRRYGDEMRALLDVAPARRGDRRDLVRGALDAWLHPPEPSYLPALAALLGGGIWTMAAARVVSQPVHPDWPGYLMEVVPFAIVGLDLPAHRGHRDRAPGRRRPRAVDRVGHRRGDRELRRVDRRHGGDCRWGYGPRRPVGDPDGRDGRDHRHRPARPVRRRAARVVGRASGRRDAAAVGRCVARLRDVLDGDRAGHPRRALPVVRRAPPPLLIRLPSTRPRKPFAAVTNVWASASSLNARRGSRRSGWRARAPRRTGQYLHRCHVTPAHELDDRPRAPRMPSGPTVTTIGSGTLASLTEIRRIATQRTSGRHASRKIAPTTRPKPSPAWSPATSTAPQTKVMTAPIPIAIGVPRGSACGWHGMPHPGSGGTSRMRARFGVGLGR